MKILDQFNIAGRSALVTGGASGIGLAYAEAMAEAGAKVTIADLDSEWFGPLLHVATWKSGKLEETIARVNAKGYGLTMGLHSRMWQPMAGSTSVLPMRVGMQATAFGHHLASATPRVVSTNLIPKSGSALSISI